MENQYFDNLDYNLRLFFRQIVKEQKMIPVDFFFQSQDLCLFLNRYCDINKQYCEELILQYSPDQITNLDIKRFKKMMENLFTERFPLLRNLNFSSNGFLLPEQQITQSIIIETLLYQFDIGQNNGQRVFNFVNLHLPKFTIEYLFEENDIKKAQQNFEQKYMELQDLVSEDLDAKFQIKEFARKFSQLAPIFTLAKNPYQYYKLSQLGCIVFQNFMRKYLTILSQSFNIMQKDKYFKDLFNCIMIFFFLFKFKENYLLYENVIISLNLSNDYLKNIIYDFNQKFLQILNDGAFFKENFEFLLHIANILENIPDFYYQIINPNFVQSIEYFLTNKADKQVFKIISSMLSQLNFSMINQNLHQRLFAILVKLNLEIDDQQVYKNSLRGIKECFKVCRDQNLLKIFDKLFEQYKKDTCQFQILSLISSLKNSDQNMFYMVINSPQFKEITDLFFKEQYPNLILLQILNDVVFQKPQLVIDEEFTQNYLNFLQLNFLNEEITFEFVFLKNLFKQYELFFLIVVKEDLLMQVFKFVELFNNLTEKLTQNDKNIAQHIFIADYYYYILTEIIYNIVARDFKSNFYAHFVEKVIKEEFIDQLDIFIQHSVNNKAHLIYLKEYYFIEEFVPEEKVNNVILQNLLDQCNKDVRTGDQFYIACRLYSLYKFEKFNGIRYNNHQKISYIYDNYRFVFDICVEDRNKPVETLQIENQNEILNTLREQLLKTYTEYSHFQIRGTIDGQNFLLLNEAEDFYQLAIEQLYTIEDNSGIIKIGLLLTQVIDKFGQCKNCGTYDYFEEMSIILDEYICSTCEFKLKQRGLFQIINYFYDIFFIKSLTENFQSLLKYIWHKNRQTIILMRSKISFLLIFNLFEITTLSTLIFQQNKIQIYNFNFIIYFAFFWV